MYRITLVLGFSKQLADVQSREYTRTFLVGVVLC